MTGLLNSAGMSEFSNRVGGDVDLTEASLCKLIADLKGLKLTLKPDHIFVTPEGLAIQRERGHRLGIPGADTMGAQELLEAMLRLKGIA